MKKITGSKIDLTIPTDPDKLADPDSLGTEGENTGGEGGEVENIESNNKEKEKEKEGQKKEEGQS